MPKLYNPHALQMYIIDEQPGDEQPCDEPAEQPGDEPAEEVLHPEPIELWCVAIYMVVVLCYRLINQ